MSRCDCNGAANRDVVDWWLSTAAKERAEKLVDSLSAANLSASPTVRDHDVGAIVLEQWPGWFKALKADVDFEASRNPLAKMLLSRIGLSEWSCKTRMAGNLGAMAKAKHGDELKALVAGNRMVRKIQEA